MTREPCILSVINCQEIQVWAKYKYSINTVKKNTKLAVILRFPYYPYYPYYPVVPTDVGTTSSCDMTHFEASGRLC